MTGLQIEGYDQQASAYCKAAVFIWCLAGWIYAALTWHVFWLPGILIFFPGIFAAGLIAAIFFIPFWFIMKKVKADLESSGDKHWSLLAIATILKLCGFLGPIAGSVLYVHVLRYFMK
ncbi:MAG: hypothetical protein WC613_06305 [Candidatus Aenigmatarchaeota archaeon]